MNCLIAFTPHGRQTYVLAFGLDIKTMMYGVTQSGNLIGVWLCAPAVVDDFGELVLVGAPE